ncbi:MAG: hypothetical protein U9R57_02340 [Thermodesulfobacteriota bacterium]|nr:hypothetical protein [Thermodesulfobacteriota bacterium]
MRNYGYGLKGAANQNLGNRGLYPNNDALSLLFYLGLDMVSLVGYSVSSEFKIEKTEVFLYLGLIQK